MTKEEYIKKYNGIYRKVDKNNKKKAKELIEKLADVLVMMDECKSHVDEAGEPLEQGIQRQAEADDRDY